ncbi:MAG: hypothetical protein LBT38_04845 [Deltaproteobacteria bacterium]|nr:hypothetical protein [Deltaproteobacteria bacterium]
MAKSALKWKDRRALIDHPKTAPEVLSRAGRELLTRGFPAESAELFRKAKDHEGLRDILAMAVGEGNFFLYSLANQYLGQSPKVEELTSLAQKAQEAGLLFYRDKAQELLGQLDQQTS